MVEPTPMNKKEAAEFLGKSVRAVQRYTSDGKLTVKYVPGKTGLEAVYDESEVRRLKEEIEIAVYQPSLDGADTAETASNATALSRATVSDLERVASTAATTFGERMMSAFEAAKPVAVADKLTLTLPEAAVLAGLSRGWLLAAIKAGALSAAKRGRGWNIKRADLDDYIRTL